LSTGSGCTPGRPAISADGGRFKANIDVIREGMTANAKSLLGLMALEAAQGTKIVIRAKGEDAEQAVAALVSLVSNRFGESE